MATDQLLINISLWDAYSNAATYIAFAEIYGVACCVWFKLAHFYVIIVNMFVRHIIIIIKPLFIYTLLISDTYHSPLHHT